MKMTLQDYGHMAKAIGTLDACKVKFAMEEYREANMSHKRFRWDLLRAVKLYPGSESQPTGWNVYDYLNDSHIDSALRHYCTQQGYILPYWPM